DSKEPKFPAFCRSSSPSSKYSLLGHGKRKEGANKFLPESLRPKYAHGAVNSNPDCDTSREPSSTGDGAVDKVAAKGVIWCICSITTDDGFTIQHKTCEVWQHAVCVNIPINESTTFAIGAILHLSAEGDSLKWLLRLSKYSDRGSRWKQTLDHRTSQRKKTPLHQALPNLSNQPDANKPYESLFDSPAARTAMGRVSSRVCVNQSTQGKPPGQSLNSHAKGKSNLTSMGYQIKCKVCTPTLLTQLSIINVFAFDITHWTYPVMRSYSSMPQVQQWSGIWLQKDNHTLQESVRKDNHTPQESVLEG
ncbi:hypothetical protein MJO29_012863, partial [Puccinia striiformis f. sp. tritici]